MKEEYVSYSQAVALKECGFDWECDRYYSKEDAADGTVWEYPNPTYENFNDGSFGSRSVSAPTLALAQKWLRDEKGWHVQVRINGVRDMFSVEIWEMTANGYFNRLEHNDGHVKLFDSYESALSAGLDVMLELIKQK